MMDGEVKLLSRPLESVSCMRSIEANDPEKGREPRWDLALSNGLRGLEGNLLDHLFYHELRSRTSIT